MAERVVIGLECNICHNRNYYFSYGKKRKEKIELKKFCKFCKKHTLHSSVKI